MVAGEYLVDVLVPVDLSFSQSFLRVGLRYLWNTSSFPFALRGIRGGKDATDAKLLEYIIH